MQNRLMQWNFETPDARQFTQPLMAGIEAGYRDRQQAAENRLAEQRVGFERERIGMERDRHASARDTEFKRRIGGLVLLAMQDEKTLPQRWPQILALHPNAAGLPQHYQDPRIGPMAVLGDAGMADDFIKFRIAQQSAAQSAATAQREAELHPHKVDLLKAQTNQANQRDVLGQAKVDILRQLGLGGGAAAQPPQPAAPSAPVKPMGYDGQADPNLIRTQAPSAPPQARGPLDNLTPSQRTGVALGIAGFGDAGKIVADADPTKLQTKTKGEVEEKMLGALDVAGRLSEIRDSFRPEFQTIENRLGYNWTAFLDKFRAGQEVITPEQRSELESFAQFRADAVDNLNNYIKYITGAAMTNAEADRILKGMPNAGTGLFDGDSPTEFKSKLNAAIRRTQMGIARYNYLRKQGFSGITADEAAVRVPINTMPRIYDQRGAEIERQIRAQNPGINDGLLRQQTSAILKQEFGI